MLKRFCAVYETKRHFQQDQRHRDQYFPEAVRGKDAPELYGEHLAAEREVYMVCAVPEMDNKGRFYFFVVEGKTTLVHK